MGVAVAAFILWSGWGLVMDTLSPLLGESPSPELVAHIEQTVMSYPVCWAYTTSWSMITAPATSCFAPRRVPGRKRPADGP